MTVSAHEAIVSELGNGLSVASVHDGNRLTFVVGLKTGSECVLHWGLSRDRGAWQRPPDDCWPQGTSAFNAQAVDTPFRVNPKGDKEVAIHLELPCRWDNLLFVLFFPREKRWLNNGGKDFSIRLPKADGAARSPEEALTSWVQDSGAARQVLPLDGGGQLAVASWSTSEAVRVRMACDASPPLLLHWGLAWQFRQEWRLPSENFRPAGTAIFDPKAARTPFGERDGLRYLELDFPMVGEPPDSTGRLRPRGLNFVLYEPETAGWLKSGGKDMYLPLCGGPVDPRLSSPKLRDLAEQIVDAEMGASYWTLMHRFNLCHDLLAGVPDDQDALALLFAWLRFSAIRQLDWQRQFNTKPRELSHAQDRLTTRLAGIWRRQTPRTAAGVPLVVAPDAHDAGPRRRGPAGPRRDPPDHAPQSHQGDQRPFRGGVAPEAPQQHDARRRCHLRGLPRLPEKQRRPGDRSTGPWRRAASRASG